ncbi:TonB-dependent siderophore receptor [Leptothermofonsia sichuanensis E412]|uniref:TonB-dependent siderophore receptor n=1 Tax=Leptothermofonsia sichuanensis TaxID=2917832 RepID=UPI001CA7AB07|nr:TonB-dependent siderophore receptor [Leptothermofonsia sichuanensis]QZZ21392.1 TonB-dependent siderophore receptor [Leptothermofonsia sichuanensis E412]
MSEINGQRMSKVLFCGWLAVLVGGLVNGLALAGRATEFGTDEADKLKSSVSSDVPSAVKLLNQRDRPATTVKEWMAQIEAATVQVVGVTLDRTDTGLEIVLTTQDGKPLQVDASKFRNEGTSLIAEIPNAVLALPEGQPFAAENPTADIATVQVVQQDGGGIRISVTGKDALPKTEVTLKTGAFAYSLNPEADEADEEIVVTGEGQRGYRVPNASTATRTDTPIRDIPQSIQVVPQEVLRDRNVRSVSEAVETVSGVGNAGDLYGSSASSRTIRGFEQAGSFRNGFRDAPNTFILSSPIGTIEQVEVLKGPASVLFGDIEPGGIVNIITKQPLSEPSYNFAFEIGNRSTYQPSLDFSGPLTDKNLLYRFIAGYQAQDGFQDFVNTNQVTVAPSITWKIGDNTELKVFYEYTEFTAKPPISYSLLLSDGRLTPRNLYTSYPNFADTEQSAQRFGYAFTHKFNDNLQIRNSFSGLIAKVDETPTYAVGVADDRFLTIESYDLDYGYDNYFGQIDLLGKFKTGSVAHQLLIGFDANSFTDSYQGRFNTNLPLLDIRNPNYAISEPEYEPFLEFENRVRSYGLYIQDQIAFDKNFKLLIGGRYDWVASTFEIGDFGAFGNTADEPERNSSAFSPRIGLVYQPNDTISLYASYSRSFRAQTGFSSSAQGFAPTEGTQYEVGIKGDWLGGKLSTTLAAYRLTKTNVLTPDPNNPQFTVQTGEQRSQGIELDVAGELLPGWKVIASYAYTDAEVTKDNTFPVGNRLSNVPANQASLWTTYEIQTGSLKGLGFGLGLFYVGERQGDLANSFQLKDYLRTDVSLFYKRDRLRLGLNIRNLFDTDYTVFAFGRTSNRRGAPFTITGSISWEF